MLNYTETSPLYNAVVKLFWWQCDKVSSCAQSIDQWFSYFKRNGASGEPQRFDPDRSERLANPFR